MTTQQDCNASIDEMEWNQTIARNKWIQGQFYTLWDKSVLTFQRVVYVGYQSVFTENDYERELEYQFRLLDHPQQILMNIPDREIDNVVFIYPKL